MIYSSYQEPFKSKKTRKYPAVDPAMHERIKHLYLNKKESSGEVRDFAKRHGLPRWKITKYAIRMGWTSKNKKSPDWSKKETAILERHAHKCPEVIQAHLKKNGFQRSVNSIVIKRKRLNLLKSLDGYSAKSLAECLGEDTHFVLRSIEKGLLKAEKRGLHRTPAQGGDIWYIRERDIKKFIISSINIIDLRKVDKYWFVDIFSSDGIIDTPGRDEERGNDGI